MDKETKAKQAIRNVYIKTFGNQNDADYKAEPGGGLAFDFKDDFMPNFYDVKDNEVELLEKMYGKDFMEGYNKLTDREKESILKCLK